jgi:hypothetical protein
MPGEPKGGAVSVGTRESLTRFGRAERGPIRSALCTLSWQRKYPALRSPWQVQRNPGYR